MKCSNGLITREPIATIDECKDYINNFVLETARKDAEHFTENENGNQIMSFRNVCKTREQAEKALKEREQNE